VEGKCEPIQHLRAKPQNVPIKLRGDVNVPGANGVMIEVTVIGPDFRDRAIGRETILFVAAQQLAGFRLEMTPFEDGLTTLLIADQMMQT